jgi:3-deoxy-D-manno-octulosonic-acid transferase
MIRLGVQPRKVSVTGNLKHSAGSGNRAGAHTTERMSLLPEVEEHRQVLVAGSTHRGEEELLLDVFLLLKSSFPALLMVLAPRHPHRFSEVEKLLQARSVRYEKKSQMNGHCEPLPDVIFLDTIGDLPAFYSLADVAFVGGSLVDAGGHNLFEPARWRKPILFGPHMTNFADIAAEMKHRGGGIEVKKREDLVRTLGDLLADRERAHKMGELAYLVVEGDRGVMYRTMNLVSPYL